MLRTAVHHGRSKALLLAGSLLTAAVWSGQPAHAAGTILDQQEAAVTAGHQPTIFAAELTLAGAQSELSTARSRAGRDQALLDQSSAITNQTAAALASDTAALGADTAAQDAATAAMVGDRSRLGVIGVELYVQPEAPTISGADALARAQQQQFANEVIDIGAASLIRDIHLRESEQRAAGKAVTLDIRRANDDRATLARVTAVRDDRTAVLARDQAAVSEATVAVTSAQTALQADDAALTSAVAALANPPGAPDDGTPSIVGESALDAAQLVGWYKAEGWIDLTPAPIEQLAAWYLSEGAAEGVRGDVAFAQAMVETGGFASSDAVNLNNYAGIGHCDTCGAGLGFPSPQLGVRGQIQLLHSFADATLTSTQLGRPLAVASLTPQTQPDRGCCPTWQSLTGKWASDPQYGHTIMGVYQSMLSFALAQRPA